MRLRLRAVRGTSTGLRRELCARFASHNDHHGRLGIRLTSANTDRINGWAEILQRFEEVDAGIQPTLFIHRRCAQLLECLPGLQHDPNRPEDVLKVDADEDGVGGDDTADALRYLVATRTRSVVQRKLSGV